MKVVAFNGSPRKDGNTTIFINRVFCELEKEGIETELVQLSGKEIDGCIACYKCFDHWSHASNSLAPGLSWLSGCRGYRVWQTIFINCTGATFPPRHAPHCALAQFKSADHI